MIIENIDQEKIKNLVDLVKKMKNENPEIEYKIFDKECEDRININIKLNQLQEKIDKLERTINKIFGNHILINGKFQNLDL